MKFSLKTLKTWLPARRREAHKGDFGRLLIVAGSRGMSGAAILAARAALRAGCGLTTLALPESQQPIAAAAVPEAMTLPLPETAAGTLRRDAVSSLMSAHEKHKFTALALGPGLTTHTETARAVVGILGSLHVPAVIDADALNILAIESRAEVEKLCHRRTAPCVLTPHPGEAARLLREKFGSGAKERESAARRLVEECGGVCLLKGRDSVIADGERVWINPTGNPGLAKGGSGDVLTGVIAAIWAQRLRVDARDRGFEAAALGAWLHGFAADCAVREKTTRCLLSTDVIEALPRAFKKLGA
ncbi:MAG: NAD(P)H-hydrate dehydratase [Elusimicrobiota bacterium]